MELHTTGSFVDTNQWVPVHMLPGFSACIEYFVSRNGEIKSTKGNIERILKPSINQQGYLQVSLTQRIGRQKPIKVLVHKLVALAFLGNPPTPYGRGVGCTLIHHKDENKTNNTLENLEWQTRSGNNNAQEYKRFYGKARPGLTVSERDEDTARKNKEYMRRKRQDPAFKEAERLKQQARREAMTAEEKEAFLEKERVRDRMRRELDRQDPVKVEKQRKYKREWARRKRAEEKKAKIE